MEWWFWSCSWGLISGIWIRRIRVHPASSQGLIFERRSHNLHPFFAGAALPIAKCEPKNLNWKVIPGNSELEIVKWKCWAEISDPTKLTWQFWTENIELRILNWIFWMTLLILRQSNHVSQDNLKIDEVYKKNEKWNMEFEAQKRASRFFRWSKLDILNVNINILGSKNMKYYWKTLKNNQKYCPTHFQKIIK